MNHRSRRFTAIDLGNGKVITPIRTEFGELEYELAYAGELIGYAADRMEAEATLDAHASALAAPTALEAAVVGALERLEEDARRQELTARRCGEKADAKFFQRAANAYKNARAAWRRGVRPYQLNRRTWLLPSNRPDGTPHLLRMDGDWTCSCESTTHIHWASALLIGLEQAADDLDRFDDPTDAEPAPAYTASDLGERLANARRLLAA